MDEQQFLNEINSIPWEQPAGNDDYRNALLVFADWLEEQGDPRSELIRLREGLLNDPTPEQRQLWEPRMQELLLASVPAAVGAWENSIGMKFCWCPPGKFLMGSPETEKDRDIGEVQVEVMLSQGFWLGKFEVTQAEYQQVMGTNPSQFSSTGGGSSKIAGQDTGRFPVEYVSWADASEFCTMLTNLERTAGHLLARWEYRLPTEVEWEYACRAGTTSATAFGDSLNSKQANFDGRFPYNVAERGPDLGRTSSVGSYPPNAWGLHDLHGNVWEWCQDWYADRLSGGSDPLGGTSGSDRVIRGGGWFSGDSFSGSGECRSASRSSDRPNVLDDGLGFRVALVPLRK